MEDEPNKMVHNVPSKQIPCPHFNRVYKMFSGSATQQFTPTGTAGFA